MGNQKTTPKASVTINPTPETQVPGVSFTPVSVQPSPLTAIANTATNTLSRLSSRNDGKAAASPVPDILDKINQEGSRLFKEAKADNTLSKTTLSNIRQSMLSMELQLAKEQGLSSSDFKLLSTQNRANINSQYADSRVEHNNVGGGLIVTSLDGDVLRTSVDQDAVGVQMALDLQEQLGIGERQGIFMGLQGLGPDGKPTDNPTQTKLDAQKTLLAHYATNRTLSHTKTQIQILEAAVKEEELTVQEREQAAKYVASEQKRSFSVLANNSIKRFLSEEKGKWLKVPTEAAIGELRTRLMRLSQGVEFDEYRLASNQPDFFKKEVDNQMIAAEAIINGLNSANFQSYSADWQNKTIQYIADKSLLDLGPQAVSQFKNSENFKNLMGVAVSMNSFVRSKGALDTALGAGLVAFSTGQKINSVKGRLTSMAPQTDPLQLSGDINWLLSQVHSGVRGLTSSNPAVPVEVSPFGVVEMIMEIKSSKPVLEYLESPLIPRSVRTDFINAINNYEDMVRQLGVTDVQLETLNRKKYKPFKIFREGVPLGEKPSANPGSEPNFTPNGA